MSKLKALIGNDGYNSSDLAILADMPALKMHMQHLKDELPKAKAELAQEKSSIESLIANARIT